MRASKVIKNLLITSSLKTPLRGQTMTQAMKVPKKLSFRNIVSKIASYMKS